MKSMPSISAGRWFARRGEAVAGFPNAHVIRNNGKDLSAVTPHWWRRFGLGEPMEFDFAFSVIVFQHIPSRAIIENYVREVHRLLRPGALFKFQVQGSADVVSEFVAQLGGGVVLRAAGPRYGGAVRV